MAVVANLELISGVKDWPVETATILESSMSARSGDIAVKQSSPVSSPRPWVPTSMAPENWAVLQCIMGAVSEDIWSAMG